LHRSNTIFFKSLKLVFGAIVLSASLIPADQADTLRNELPRIVTNPLIRATSLLLKHGLWGTAFVKVGIDSTGSVDSCIVASSETRAFDSFVKDNVVAAQFTPAIKNNIAIASYISFEIVIPRDSLVAQCLRLPPDFNGTVVDTARKRPVPNTRILMHFIDSTEDSAITIGFNRYLSLIGNSTHQTYNGTVLSTVTDPLGRFAFRLLPRGHFTVSVQSEGYEIAQFSGCIAGNRPQQCRYMLRPSEVHFTDSTREITVYGHQTFSGNKIEVTEGEKHTGFSPFLSNVIQAKAEIRRVPEGPSMMLVRSGCPYDNVYVVAGVPMLAPFHFGGYPYADMDGLMISALSTVKVTINDIAAKRTDASGCIVEADPGKIRYDNDSTAKGFYLKGDVSYNGVDFLAAYAPKKTAGDYVQIGYSASDDYLLKFNYHFYSSVAQGNQGIGVPQRYGNATLAGSKSVGPLRCTAFGWLAWDSYTMLKPATEQEKRRLDSIVFFGLDAGATFFPWGTGSVKFTAGSPDRSLTIGGAHQFFGSGRQSGAAVITTRSFLTNGEATVDFDTVIRSPFTSKLTARIGHDEWNGFLLRKTIAHADTSYVHGAETAINLNSSLTRQTGRITTELDLLASAIRYTDSTRLIGDAGASATYEGDDYHAGIYFGRVTSRPDVRGLPDPLFRMQLNRTYIASLPIFFRYGIITKFGIEPYVRYCNDAPQLNPVDLVWDPDKSTPVLARGADFDFRMVPLSWAELSAALNLADARRLNASGDPLPYEWDLPWTVRTSLHLHSKSDRLHLYADYIRSKGLLYYDFDNQAYEALPVYRSLDLNFQIRTFIPSQRHLNKLDCYFTIKNVQDLISVSTNVRDYYWDAKGQRQPVYLGYGRMDIGARCGIRP
jgi:hypothetical protein